MQNDDTTRTFVSSMRHYHASQPCQKLCFTYPPELLNQIPKVPASAYQHLLMFPTALEIKNAMMSLGPDKAPGPDGFNARIIQANWDLFGPSIIEQVNLFFRSNTMPRQIARSNLVLVPKCENPTKLTDFRPISVCNVLYKLISKILAARVRPFIARCVSPSQSAFVPGREISENVILLREVLHSFRSNSYKGEDFCLKLDLSKAFDRMNWDYMRDVLLLYGWPALFTNWVMTCVRSAEYYVILNGHGDGFFRPEAGLRQGCALSPYLFILGMDILSRSLEYLVKGKFIKGVKLAPSAEALTNCLYADDLLVFGAASIEEAGYIKVVVNNFCQVSGQKVGLDKSNIWFSHKVNESRREEVAGILSVPQDSACEKYLGAMIGTNVSSYNFLLEKFSSRLQAWQGRLLSHAGRVVVIKSVLQSLPIYYMATSLIPQGVLTKIEVLIRGFFWGKQDRAHYLAYVAWKKIKAPIEDDGLGLRDLGKVNEAMLMKSLWKLAVGSDSLWVQQVRAKYLPRSQLWHSKRVYNCTIFWRGVMALRQWLRWKVGNGRRCRAFAEPWFEGALEHMPTMHGDHLVKLCELVNEQTGVWDSDKLVQLFGHAACVTILSNVTPPKPQSGEDKLLFSLSSNGKFTVNSAYKGLMLVSQQVGNTEREVWTSIWKKGKIVPRLRLFIWKLLNEALPLGNILTSRIRRGDPTCHMCGAQSETVNHFLFLCPFSRGCWLASPLPLRTENLSVPLIQVLHELGGLLTPQQWTDFVCISWSIWRCRNDLAYSGKVPSIASFHKYLCTIENETSVAATVSIKTADSSGGHHQNEAGRCCYTDGAWTQNWEAGVGFVLFEGQTLLAYKVKHVTAFSPLHAEALGLLQAIKFCIENRWDSCVFASDCSNLVRMVTQPIPPEADWTASREVGEIWEILRRNENLRCIHISRSHNELADNLANKARRGKIDYLGYTFPIFPA
ncbi:uncharacterized protein LOC144546765 [Carex rostrata]